MRYRTDPGMLLRPTHFFWIVKREATYELFCVIFHFERIRKKFLIFWQTKLRVRTLTKLKYLNSIKKGKKLRQKRKNGHLERQLYIFVQQKSC